MAARARRGDNSKRTLFVTHPHCAEHRIAHHPEQPKRVEAIERQTAKVLAREEKKDQEYVSSFLAALRAKAIESMHALLEAEADDDDA